MRKRCRVALQLRKASYCKPVILFHIILQNVLVCVIDAGKVQCVYTVVTVLRLLVAVRLQNLYIALFYACKYNLIFFFCRHRCETVRVTEYRRMCQVNRKGQLHY